MEDKLMRLRYQNKNMNTFADDILFSNYNIKKVTSLFLPLLAGVTQKDPSYMIRRTTTDSYFAYVYVFEYVRSGKGYIECNGVKYTVAQGDFYLLNAGHAPYYYPDRDDPYEKIWFNAAGRFLNALFYAYRISEPVLVLHMNAEPYLLKIHEELAHYDFESSDESNLRLMHILLELFGEIRRCRKLEGRRHGSNVDDIAAYISENITSDQLTVPNISSIFYISERTLHRLFVRRFGVTPIHFITEQKTAYAKYLLSSTELSVERISDILNFSSMEYFRKTFVRYCGCSPQKWRKQNRPPAADKSDN